MFEIKDGGESSPIEWNKDNLQPDRIIMVLDELNSIVWLFYGKKKGLVSRRTAMRQAQSMKGHGFTSGRSIIGRNVSTIVEIEERKLGRDPETDANHTKFLEILSKTVIDEGNFIMRFGTAGITEPSVKMYSNIGETPKIQTRPAVKPVTNAVIKPAVKTLPHPKPMPKPAATIKPVVTTEPIKKSAFTPISEEKIPSFASSEYSEDTISIPEPTKLISNVSDDQKLGLVLMSIMSQIRDIWSSKRDDGSIDVEQIDGPVCKFMIENGKVIFKAGSFNGVDSQIKNSILSKLREYGIE